MKPTYQTLSYLSIVPLKYKVFAIEALLHRWFVVSRSWSALHADLIKIMCLLTNNNFPIKLIEKDMNNLVICEVKNVEDKVGSELNLYFYFKYVEVSRLRTRGKTTAEFWKNHSPMAKLSPSYRRRTDWTILHNSGITNST